MPSKISSIRAQLGQNKLKVIAKGDKPKEADILIYADIGAGGWFSEGVSAKSFSDELNALPSSVESLNIRINSPGGDVFDGMTIYNRLRQHKAKKKVFVDGLAASIASVIAMAGDEVIMGQGSMLMIHKPWTWAVGNSDELEAKADVLDSIEDQMIAIYMKKSNLSREQIVDKLRAETWLKAEEAVEFGFATSVSEEEAAIAASAMDKKWFRSAPRNVAMVDGVIKQEAAAMKAKIDARLAQMKK